MPRAKHDLPRRGRAISDPLAAALQPPPGETLEQREQRIKAESDAKKVSDGIDEMLRAEKKKARPEVNVLLLGQSESGKSTTLKQFQLLHSPKAFHAERIAWRAVIYLNLVRSIRRILEAIAPDESDVLDDHDDDSIETASVIITASGRPPSAILGTRVPNYEYYRQKLEPLMELEERLTRLLSSPDEEEATRLGPIRPGWDSYLNGDDNFRSAHNGGYPATNGRPAPTIQIPAKKQTSASLGSKSSGSQIPSPSSGTGSSSGSRSKAKEVAVHTSSNWKKAFSLGNKSKSPKSAHSGEVEGWWEDPDDPVHTINRYAEDMKRLWHDPKVRQHLHEKRVRLEEAGGFYLNEISRITAIKYIPTDNDVLKARLKTMGVVEHTFSIQSGSNRGVEWRIYDVGGARNQRQAWAPYFDWVNAIIFLAPISAFDQVLAEDPHVNRLEDSILLWKSVVENKLLAHVNIVLFLNKCDLLEAKIEAGEKLCHHMISYGDRPNEYDSITKYFRHKFSAIHQSYTPNKEREVYIQYTTVTDTRRTATIIATVRDIIIKNNLRSMRLV